MRDGTTTPVQRKMEIVHQAVLEIQNAESEKDACIQALIALEQINYPNAMVSFLQTIDGVRYVVADPTFAVGEKWSRIAAVTRRDYDNPTDLLPLVLRRKIARFIPDSRNDPTGENDPQICHQLDLISQYVMPLRTDSMEIGTLQIDMGRLMERPAAECAMLDALAAHLSIAIERHRLKNRLTVLEEELLRVTAVAAYGASGSATIHHLHHGLLRFKKALDTSLEMNAIKGNRDAYDFLKLTLRYTQDWLDTIRENISTITLTQRASVYPVEDAVKESLVQVWNQRLDSRQTLRGIYEAPNTHAKFRLVSLREILSCLITNSFQARARAVTVIVRNAHHQGEWPVVSSYLPAETTLQAAHHVEIAVQDDGDGVPDAFREKIQRFGWTSKGTRGTGIGLTVADLLAKEMDAQLLLRSGGKSQGQAFTEFALLIPACPIGERGGRDDP